MRSHRAIGDLGGERRQRLPAEEYQELPEAPLRGAAAPKITFLIYFAFGPLQPLLGPELN